MLCYIFTSRRNRKIPWSKPNRLANLVRLDGTQDLRWFLAYVGMRKISSVWTLRDHVTTRVVHVIGYTKVYPKPEDNTLTWV